MYVCMYRVCVRSVKASNRDAFFVEFYGLLLGCYGQHRLCVRGRGAPSVSGSRDDPRL